MEGNEISLMDVLPGEGDDICEKVDKKQKLKEVFAKLLKVN